MLAKCRSGSRSVSFVPGYARICPTREQRLNEWIIRSDSWNGRIEWTTCLMRYQRVLGSFENSRARHRQNCSGHKTLPELMAGPSVRQAREASSCCPCPNTRYLSLWRIWAFTLRFGLWLARTWEDRRRKHEIRTDLGKDMSQCIMGFVAGLELCGAFQ